MTSSILHQPPDDLVTDFSVPEKYVVDHGLDLESPVTIYRRSTDKPFLCGVVEGFYGRPWNSYQRLVLFERMKTFDMSIYLYAPKDDVKHRAYWRDLYTVEEAENLTELIKAATINNIQFVYGVSPGIDITYSSTKDVSILRRKLEQVLSFGCKSFAILFDDIEPEMNKADKEVFQSFAHAQTSVANQIYEHLKQPMFMFCPTEYCGSRAVPTVETSQYLKVIGEKLLPGIEVLWTGPKVVSKTIPLSSIKQVAKVLRRPPLIWDNIHANDYDHKRIFLGPYSGRDPCLIPWLAGVLTNPNCEFEPNFVALHSLALWNKAEFNEHRHNSISTEVLVEQSSLPEDTDVSSNYSPAHIHRISLMGWLPTFYVPSQVNTSRPAKLEPLQDVESQSLIVAQMSNEELSTSASSNVKVAMHSSEIANSNIDLEPMDVLGFSSNSVTQRTSLNDASSSLSRNKEDEMLVDNKNLVKDNERLTIDDLAVLCDMFYLPYEHGSKGLYLLAEFEWLKTYAHSNFQHQTALDQQTVADSVQLNEWERRALDFKSFVNQYNKIVDKFTKIPNKSLQYDLLYYLWDLRETLSVVAAHLEWIAGTRGKHEQSCEFQHTWSLKEYGELFMSSENEVWVFRGGLIGALQRALQIDVNLFSHYRSWEHLLPVNFHTFRLYSLSDEDVVYGLTKESYLTDFKDEEYKDLVSDLMVGGFLTLSYEQCFVVEDSGGICGCVMVAPCASAFHQKLAVSWLPEMQKKYPFTVDQEKVPTLIKPLVKHFLGNGADVSSELLTDYPALVALVVAQRVQDFSVNKRLLACAFAALKSLGVDGAHSVEDNADGKHCNMYRALDFFAAGSSLQTFPNGSRAIFVRKF